MSSMKMTNASTISYKTASRELRVPTGSPIPHILLAASQILLLASPPFKGRRTLSVYVILSLLAFSQLDPYFSTNISLAQPVSIGWAFALSTLEKLALQGPAGPEAAFWRIDHTQGEATTFSAFSFQKLRWALALITNARGIRWNFQVKKVPPLPPRGSRTSFVFWQTLNAVYYILMADLFASLGIHWFWTGTDGTVGGLDNLTRTIQHPDWRWSFARAFVFGATPYYMLSAQYTIGSIIAVSTGISKPEDWPAHFGKLTDVTTVREFWGKYWHQTLRRLWNAWSGYLVDTLRIPRGTNLSSYTQLYFSFLVSGLMHANAMRSIPSPSNLDVTDYTVGWIPFFAYQALAVTCEDFAHWCFKRVYGEDSMERPSAGKTLVGYLWVTVNVWYSLPWIGDLMLRMGMGEERVLPVEWSPAAGWVRGLPLPP